MRIHYRDSGQRMRDRDENDDHGIDRTAGARLNRRPLRRETEPTHEHASRSDRHLRHMEPARVVGDRDDHVAARTHLRTRYSMARRIADEPDQGTRCLGTERGRGDHGNDERKREMTDGGHEDLARRTLPAIYSISSWSERLVPAEAP